MTRLKWQIVAEHKINSNPRRLIQVRWNSMTKIKHAMAEIKVQIIFAI